MLKLIGAPNRTIVAMIVQQALALGLTGFLFGTLLIANIKGFFPRRVVLEPDNVLALGGVVFIVCILASGLGVRAALGPERRASTPCVRSPSTSRPVRLWRYSVRLARAKPHCSTSSRASWSPQRAP